MSNKQLPEDKPGPGWFTAVEMHEILGCETSNFDKVFKPLAQGENEVRKVGQRNWYHAPTMLRKWKNKPASKGNHTVPAHLRGVTLPPSEDDDPLLTTQGNGDVGGALELYRKERWRLARLERRTKEGTLLPREVVHSTLTAMADLWRGACDKIQRLYGADAYETLEEARLQAARLMEERFAENEPKATGSGTKRT